MKIEAVEVRKKPLLYEAILVDRLHPAFAQGLVVVQKEGDPVTADLDLVRFGSLPSSVLSRMGIVAHHCADFLRRPIILDRFRQDNEARTDWIESLRTDAQGNLLADFFRSTRMRANFFQFPLSAFSLRGRLDTPEALAHPDTDKLMTILEGMANLMPVDEDGFPSQNFRPLYDAMSIPERVGLIETASAHAKAYLDFVAPKKPEPEKL